MYLTEKTFFAGTAKKTGTMVNQGGVTQYLDAGKRVAIPKGFHNGNGLVVARELGVQTPGTAAATGIANGKTAWVNGQKVTGSLSVIASGQYVESGLAEITKDGKKAVLFRVYADDVVEPNVTVNLVSRSPIDYISAGVSISYL